MGLELKGYETSLIFSTTASGIMYLHISCTNTTIENSAIILLVHMNSIEHSFTYFGLEIAGRNPSYSSLRLQKSYHNKRVEEQIFRALFGCSLQIIIDIWQKISVDLPQKTCPYHLLWSLLFMKIYGNEESMMAMCGVKCPKTFRKWTNICINVMSASLYSTMVSYQLLGLKYLYKEMCLT